MLSSLLPFSVRVMRRPFIQNRGSLSLSSRSLFPSHVLCHLLTSAFMNNAFLLRRGLAIDYFFIYLFIYLFCNVGHVLQGHIIHMLNGNRCVTQSNSCSELTNDWNGSAKAKNKIKRNRVSVMKHSSVFLRAMDKKKKIQTFTKDQRCVQSINHAVLAVISGNT